MGPRRGVPKIVRHAATGRTRVALIAGVLAIGWSAGAGSFGARAVVAVSPAPRVVIVVGPSGAATDGYRAQARDAAAVARRFTSDVTEVYSPNATWPAVRAALQGASVVIYMGHGNGWPSPYRDALSPASQDGFGLNPRAGAGDTDHQYFGEAAIGSQIRLASNAVVLLHHLCYASGLAEPGVPEGTVDVARQRVDDFAAGFIRAGASAVIADAYASPTIYLASVLGGGRSIDSIWRHAPDANGHAFAFESVRSPGFVAQMDPDSVAPAAAGFTRSIVLRAGLTPADVRAGAQGRGTGPVGGGPVAPSLVSSGIRFGSPSFETRTAAGTTTRFDLPFQLGVGNALPVGIEASVRWKPIALVTPPAPPPTPGASPPLDVPVPGLPGEVAPPPIAPLPPPDGTGLVVAEQPADVVAPVGMSVRDGRLTVPIAMPVAPGQYELAITLHDADGVAFDAASQALLPSLVVRVAADVDGTIVAAPVMTLTAGSGVDLPVRVTNPGDRTWGAAAVLDVTGGTAGRSATQATLVGWWLPSGEALASTALPPALEPGASTDTAIALLVPRPPGHSHPGPGPRHPRRRVAHGLRHRPDARPDHGRRAPVTSATKSPPRAPRFAASPGRPTRPCSPAMSRRARMESGARTAGALGQDPGPAHLPHREAPDRTSRGRRRSSQSRRDTSRRMV